MSLNGTDITPEQLAKALKKIARRAAEKRSGGRVWTEPELQRLAVRKAHKNEELEQIMQTHGVSRKVAKKVRKALRKLDALEKAVAARDRQTGGADANDRPLTKAVGAVDHHRMTEQEIIMASALRERDAL